MRHSTLNPFRKTTAFIAIAAFNLLASAEGQIRYELVIPEILGNPINTVSSQSNEINENGETLLNRISTFAVWKDGAITHIANANTDYPASLSSINASSINSFHQAVGTKTYRIRDEEGTHLDSFPFYWDPSNGVVDLDDLGSRAANGSGSTSLFEINNEGLALGVTQLFDGNQKAGNQAFTWSFEKGRTDIAAISSLNGFSTTTPESLNEAGTVVGTYRYFTSTTESYHERAFIYDAANGSQDLADIDPDFFQADHYTARDINDTGTIVGDRDRNGYIYDKETGLGYSIEAADNSSRSTKAYTLNDNDVVAGVAENRSSASHLGYSPILWTRSTGTIELLPFIERQLEAILPEGIDAASCNITPKSINNAGQISASLETNNTFSREVILKPVLDFHWSTMTPAIENETRGVLYSYNKSNAFGTIPAAALGYEIVFECSSDMKTWSTIPSDSDQVRHQETADSIELFVPFADCLFIRPALKQITANSQTTIL